MKVYATTKNTGPSWSSDPIHLVYLGTSLDQAVNAVEDFSKYELPEHRWPREEYNSSSSVIPKQLNWNMVRYYMVDGWWYSIVMFELEEQ